MSVTISRNLRNANFFSSVDKETNPSGSPDAWNKVTSKYMNYMQTKMQSSLPMEFLTFHSISFFFFLREHDIKHRKEYHVTSTFSSVSFQLPNHFNFVTLSPLPTLPYPLNYLFLLYLSHIHIPIPYQVFFSQMGVTWWSERWGRTPEAILSLSVNNPTWTLNGAFRNIKLSFLYQFVLSAA